MPTERANISARVKVEKLQGIQILGYRAKGRSNLKRSVSIWEEGHASSADDLQDAVIIARILCQTVGAGPTFFGGCMRVVAYC